MQISSVYIFSVESILLLKLDPEWILLRLLSERISSANCDDMCLFTTVAHGCHGTNKNFTAQTKTLTAQTKTSRHKHKLSRHKQKHHGTNENSHGTNKNFTAQTKTLTAEVIFAAEIKILYHHTSGYSVARKYGGICGTRWRLWVGKRRRG